MKVTISDVASLAGVAKSTVSRYLNGGYVSTETRKKIDQVIKQTKFEPNNFAQSLKAKETNLVGVIVPRLNTYTVSLTLKGIDKKLREAGYQMLISNADQSPERELESLINFSNQKVAGIILMSSGLTPAHHQTIRDINVPVLSVGQSHPQISSLSYADEEAGFVLGKYLLECGHKRMIFAGVDESDEAVGRNRRRGFEKAVAGQGCQVRYLETGFLMKESFSLFEVLELYGETVIACATDNIALGAMKALGQRGLKIPEDISVTGFGDYEIADVMGLTTMRYPYEETGELAAQKILHKDFATLKNPLCEIIVRNTVDILN